VADVLPKPGSTYGPAPEVNVLLEPKVPQPVVVHEDPAVVNEEDVNPGPYPKELDTLPVTVYDVDADKPVAQTTVVELVVVDVVGVVVVLYCVKGEPVEGFPITVTSVVGDVVVIYKLDGTPGTGFAAPKSPKPRAEADPRVESKGIVGPLCKPCL
jgi:hypothetical protein